MLENERQLPTDTDASTKPWVVVIGAGTVLQEKHTPTVSDKLNLKS